MSDDGTPSGSTPDERGSAEPSARDVAEQALRGSAFASLASGDQPLGTALLAAVGGVRGLLESLLPGLLFLIVYTVTKNVLWSVAAPAAIGVVFLAIRVVRRETVVSAIFGLVIMGISAVLAVVSGRAENNFIPGFVINAIGLVVIVVSLVVRRPLIGVIAGLLFGYRNWRRRRARRRTALWATVLWLALFGIRLGVEVPVWLLALNATDPAVVESATSALATARLVLGVPLYALILGFTWLLMRGPWTPREKPLEAGSAAVASGPRADDAADDVS